MLLLMLVKAVRVCTYETDHLLDTPFSEMLNISRVILDKVQGHTYVYKKVYADGKYSYILMNLGGA